MEEKIAGLKALEKENKQKNNRKFIVLALICCVYFLVPSGVVIALATLFLFWIFYSIQRQNRDRIKTFEEQQKPFVEQFSTYIKEHISPQGQVQAACGYLEDSDDFQNVTLFTADGRLYVKRQLIQTKFVYSINNKFWYLFSMRELEDTDLLEVEQGSIKPEVCQENHQDLLRAKAMKWNRLTIMEGYIYDRFIPQILERRLVGQITMDSGIDSLRKEKIYSANTPNGVILYLTERAVKALGYTL